MFETLEMLAAMLQDPEREAHGIVDGAQKGTKFLRPCRLLEQFLPNAVIQATHGDTDDRPEQMGGLGLLLANRTKLT